MLLNGCRIKETFPGQPFSILKGNDTDHIVKLKKKHQIKLRRNERMYHSWKNAQTQAKFCGEFVSKFGAEIRPNFGCDGYDKYDVWVVIMQN